MSRHSYIVVGSGAGGSVAAWALANAGAEVLVLERGRNLLPGLGSADGLAPSVFSNDPVKEGRSFENQDPVLEPRTSRSQDEARQGVDRSNVGDVNDLPATVGGGTIHWDAKVPRFWRQDFKGRSLFGPVAGANVADWPIDYEDLAPYYDIVEAQLGVQGDRSRMPKSTLAQAPRGRDFPLPPNPPMLAGELLAAGARRAGYHPYPFPMAVHSRPWTGGVCNSCGFCSGYGCPVMARGCAGVSFLHPAMRAGARLVTRAFVNRIELAPGGRRAVGVSYLDAAGHTHHVRADTVVIAASPIETARLLLLSTTADHPAGLANRSGQLGANLMFHLFTLGIAIFEREVHTERGPSTTVTIDDLVGPFTDRAARATGQPYLKGGICETGGGILLSDEASIYTALPNRWGAQLKTLMRDSPGRAFLAGLSMVAEDLPQHANRVDLDPTVRDFHGLPAPRITHSLHPFEVAASHYLGPRLGAICKHAPEAIAAAWIPVGALAAQTGGFSSPYAGQASTAHIMGTARMGNDPASSVTDRWGRLHDIDNVYVADGSVFVSSGGFNPTLTIMAHALRLAHHLGGTFPTVDHIVNQHRHGGGSDGPSDAVLGLGAGAVAVTGAVGYAAYKRRTNPPPDPEAPQNAS